VRQPRLLLIIGCNYLNRLVKEMNIIGFMINERKKSKVKTDPFLLRILQLASINSLSDAREMD